MNNSTPRYFPRTALILPLLLIGACSGTPAPTVKSLAKAPVSTTSAGPAPIASPASSTSAPGKPPPPPTWTSTTPCDVVAAQLQPLVSRLLQEGRIERTGRVIQKAIKLCPQTAQTSQTSQTMKEAIALYEKESEASPTDGQALLNAGFLATKFGKKADARRYFDQALAVLEAKGGATARADVQKSFPAALTLFRRMAFSPDGQRIVVGTSHGMSIVETTMWREKFRQDNPPDDPPDDTSDFPKASPMQLETLAVSPDDTRIVIGTRGGFVQFRDARTGAPLGPSFKAHTKAVNAIAFSPDNTRIVTGSGDRTIRVWKIVNDKLTPVVTLKNAGFVPQLAFSPDNTLIVGAIGETVSVWNARTGARVHHFKGPDSQFPYEMVAAFSPDGAFVAAGASWDSDNMWIWDTKTGALVRTIPVFKNNEDQKRVNHIVYSRDGKQIIVQFGVTKVGVWDVQTGIKVLTIETGMVGLSVDTMDLSPDGKKLVLGCRLGHLLVYDMTTGAKLHDSRGTNTANSAEFFPDGKRIVSGAGSTIKIWHGDGSGSFRTLVGHPGDVTSVARSPDGKRIASASNGDNTVRMWDAETGAALPSLTGHTGPVNAVAFSPNGKRIASAASDKSVRIWDATTLEPLRTLTGFLGGYGYAAVFSPDSQYIASKTEMSATVTNVETGKVSMQHDFRNPVYGMSFYYGPTAFLLAIGNNDDLVHVRYAGSPLDEYTYQVHEPHAVAASPGSQYIAAGQLTLADTTRRGVVRNMTDDGIYPVTSLAFNDKADLLLSASRNGMLRLWRVADGVLLLRMNTVSGKDAGYVFTPHGEMDFVGPDACAARDLAVCQVGSAVLPFEVCEDRFYAPGLLDRILSGQPAALEPEVALPPLACPRGP